MDKGLAEFLIIVLTGAMAGISTPFWIQAIVVDDGLGLNNDILTFIASAITSGLAISCIVLIFTQTPRLPFFLTIGIAILWVICLIIYCLRDDTVDVYVVKLVGLKYNRTRDIIRSVIYLCLSLATILFHVMAGSHNS